MDFKQALEKRTPIFDSIIDIMKSGRNTPEETDGVYKFLIVVNQIIDYYLDRNDDTLKIPIVYFPMCDDISQELCEEFVALKFGFYSNSLWRENVVNSLKIITNRGLVLRPDEKTESQVKLARQNFKYQKNLKDILSRSISNNIEHGSTLLFSDSLLSAYSQHIDAQKLSNRKTANKYWYLSNAINRNYTCNDKGPLSLISGSPENLYNYIINPGEGRKIENLVIFPCRNADGDYMPFCSDIFQKSYLNNFVAAGSGLRNVFFFRFSRKPFRLRRLLDMKNVMLENLQISSEETDLFDYITFNYEESSYLFNKRPPKIANLALGKDADETQKDLEVLFDDFISGFDKYILRRNEVSLCITPELCDYYSNKMAQETEVESKTLTPLFKINVKLWQEKVENLLSHFLDKDEVCIIVGNEVDPHLKNVLREWLKKTYNLKNVQYASYGDLRGYLKNGIYQNDIQINRIIILSFRNDYTESIFHKYPNSFDPICVNKNQKILVIENYYMLRNYYAWGWYNYHKAETKILKSDFRSKIMNTKKRADQRPSKPLPEDSYDEENDRNVRAVQQIIVELSNSTSRSYNKNEWMLYKNKSHDMSIAPLSDLADLYSDSTDGLELYPMSSLVRFVYEQYVEQGSVKDTEAENLFKESHHLSDEEKRSGIQLWKILLQRKIESSSAEAVYNEIMSHFNSEQRVSFYAFSKWVDKDYGLPRSNRMQEYLIVDYLGIIKPYLKLVRRIKERNKNNTEDINTTIRHFLGRGLFTDNYSKLYTSLKEDTCDLLGIDDESDVKEIIQAAKNNIKFESIKTIK